MIESDENWVARSIYERPFESLKPALRSLIPFRNPGRVCGARWGQWPRNCLADHWLWCQLWLDPDCGAVSRSWVRRTQARSDGNAVSELARPVRWNSKSAPLGPLGAARFRCLPRRATRYISGKNEVTP